ncbi:13540_t:CDS:2, partial [Dentiscutata heterogama]
IIYSLELYSEMLKLEKLYLIVLLKYNELTPDANTSLEENKIENEYEYFGNKK